VLDFSRVPSMSTGAAKILADLFAGLRASGVTPVASGFARSSINWSSLAQHLVEDAKVRDFAQLDEAIEWAEDQIIFRFGGLMQVQDVTNLKDQELLAGLPDALIEEVTALGNMRVFHTGERIFASGADSTSIFFLQRGMVSVKLPDGVRLATLVPGTAFGEMCLFEKRRTADVWADSPVRCTELPLIQFHKIRQEFPQFGEQIMRNLAGLLVKRLGRANRRIDLLSGPGTRG